VCPLGHGMMGTTAVMINQEDSSKWPPPPSACKARMLLHIATIGVCGVVAITMLLNSV